MSSLYLPLGVAHLSRLKTINRGSFERISSNSPSTDNGSAEEVFEQPGGLKRHVFSLYRFTVNELVHSLL